jgi:hypothetical protein
MKNYRYQGQIKNTSAGPQGHGEIADVDLVIESNWPSEFLALEEATVAQDWDAAVWLTGPVVTEVEMDYSAAG